MNGSDRTSQGATRLDAGTKLIGVLEIIGGLSGLATVLWLVRRQQGGIPGGNVQFALLPFAVLTTAGIALLRSNRLGLWLSLVMQIGQVLGWSLQGTMWKFSAGPFVTLTMLSDKTSIFAGWNTSFGVGRIPENVPVLLSVNLVPAALALFLWHRLSIPEKIRARR